MLVPDGGIEHRDPVDPLHQQAGNPPRADQTGPTVWMTHLAARSPAVVATAWPVGSPSGRVLARSSRVASRIAGPPRR